MENDTENAYNELISYPLPQHVVTYRKQVYSNNLPYRFIKTTFHDLIYLNMQELIPNIELGLFENKTNEQIKEWIEKTKQYNLSMYNHFQSILNQKSLLINSIIQLDEDRKQFDMEKCNDLPCDIIKNILYFLTPDTRIILLTSRYPNLKTNMTIWKVSEIKQFYKEVVLAKYVNKIRDNYSKRSLKQLCFGGISMPNKGAFIDEIFNIIDVLQNAIPRDIDNYYSYKHQALKLLMSVIFVDNHIQAKHKSKKSKKSKKPKK